MDDRVFQWLSEGASLITPTQRLARHLRYQFAKKNIANDKRAWETPDILPWSGWCKRNYKSLSDLDSIQILLNPAQQLWILQEIIKSSPDKDKLLHITATARQVAHSYQVCKEWCIPIFPKGVYPGEDAMAFKNWVNSYEERKQKEGLTDEASLPDILVNEIEADKLKNSKIVFYGFDYLTTQQINLIQSLKESAVKVIVYEFDDHNIKAVKNEYIEQKKELYAAAAWARKQLEQNPSASIGIVSLNLNSIREDIDHGFRSVFMPDTGNISTYTNQNLYSISIGQPLSAYPLVQTAINLLMLGTRSVDINTFDKLLHSPFIKGSNEEYSKRAQFYYLLRQFGEQKIGFKALYWIHSERCHEFARCDEFIELLKSFELSVLSHAKQHTLNEWIVIFSEWLKLFGWPGERSLTSDEHQTVNAWQAALSQLGSLSSVVSGPVNFQTAIYQLNRILSDSRFQPETEETPVQILGLTGAAGMQFDCLWVLGMQDDAWPEKKITNPFIPRSCLKDYNVPGSSAELQYEKARKMTQQLIESSKHVVFSYTRQESDKECRPSPLIKSIDRDKNNYLDIYPKFISTIFSSARIEKFIDLENPAASVAKEVKGGSLLFKDQAACSFKAFARHRLHAQSLQNIDIGLNAMERGNLAHRSLQYLWQRLKDSENLHYKSDAEIQSLIVSVIDDAIKQQALYQPETFTDRFTELEKKRLQRLLSDWLSIERQRDQFKVVATEKKKEIKFSGINLQLRVDRIDELDDGRFVIIDYKTGQISVRDWDSENPKDPQLPLYAVTSEQKIVALAFASLKRGKLGYVGYSEEENLLPAIKTNNSIKWNEQIKIWRNILTKLAENFCKGDINVDPTVTACRYCDLHSLCRVYDRIENPDDINREDPQDA